MSLQIHITAGSKNGQRLAAHSGSIVFGRDPANAIVVDLPHISRKHGELVAQPDGSWSLVNHSPNGTILGKKNVTTKPHPITGTVSVFIDRSEVMRLTAAPVNPGDASSRPTSEATDKPSGGPMKWVLVAVCVLSAGIMLAKVMLPDSGGKKSPAVVARDFEPMTPEQLAKMIEAPPTEPYQPDLVAYEAAISMAKGVYNPASRPTMNREAWLDAYKAYREAMRHNSRELSTPDDKTDCRAVTAEVVKLVTSDYSEACLAYNRFDYRDANRLFGKISTYAGGPNPLFGAEFRNHILKLQGLADPKRKK